MKVLCINASPRKEGNTHHLLSLLGKELEQAGIACEQLSLAGKRLKGCIACYKCKDNLDRRCAVDNDDLNGVLSAMLSADALVLGSPTYFSDVTAEMKALIDRSGMVARVNGDLFRRKAGAAVVAVRRAGSIHAFDTLNHFFLIGQMIVVGSSYWNVGIGKDPGDVQKDEEGLATMRTLAANLAWLLPRLQ